ncbi:MAG: hypothetical protein WCV90_01705 [Candidatus Woesearchaeota archaeon]|jgi:hypothetical protein
MVNDSKKRSLRHWDIWDDSGAIGGIDTTAKRVQIKEQVDFLKKYSYKPRLVDLFSRKDEETLKFLNYLSHYGFRVDVSERSHANTIEDKFVGYRGYSPDLYYILEPRVTESSFKGPFKNDGEETPIVDLNAEQFLFRLENSLSSAINAANQETNRKYTFQVIVIDRDLRLYPPLPPTLKPSFEWRGVGVDYALPGKGRMVLDEGIITEEGGTKSHQAFITRYDVGVAVPNFDRAVNLYLHLAEESINRLKNSIFETHDFQPK